MFRLLLTSTVLTGIALAPSALVVLHDVALAQPGKKTPRQSQPVQRGHTAPDVTATIPQAGKPGAVAVPDIDKDDESLPAPFNLPTASRARIRACGEAWQAMKMSGTAADQTWRAYATKCLASKDGPETTKSP